MKKLGKLAKNVILNKYVRFVLWYAISMGATLGAMFGIMEGLQKIPYFDLSKDLK